MREDMAKIIVERPRISCGSRTPKGSRRLWSRLPPEEWPIKEGMRARWRHGRKCLNENLAPLRRFLRSRVGQPWDGIYSEICQRINLNSAVQLHIWQHIQNYVCLNTIEVAGKPLESRGRHIRERFYLDPSSGKLVENREYRARKPRQLKPQTVIRYGPWEQYRKLNEIWYWIQLKPLQGHWETEWDVVFGDFCHRITCARLHDYYGCSGFAVAKLQLNTKEIEDLLKIKEQVRNIR